MHFLDIYICMHSLQHTYGSRLSALGDRILTSGSRPGAKLNYYRVCLVPVSHLKFSGWTESKNYAFLSN